MKRRLAILIVLVPLVAGCSTASLWGKTVIPPEVHIADLELVESGLFEQKFRVTLRVLNPNDFVLPLEGVRFGLDLNDQPFARGFASQGVTVPRLGYAMVAVDATTSTFDVVRQVLALSRSQSISYALDGTAFVGGGTHKQIPFQQKGSLQLLPSEAIHKLVPALPSGP